MFKVGLCSVTFRELSVEQIIALSVHAGLEGIEWGGDYHVPPGDLKRAEEAAKLTEQASMEVVSYGSYYRFGYEEESPFQTILDTAIQLKAPAIRVWAGKVGSTEANKAERQRVVEDAQRIADLAHEHQIAINFEYHGGTLTDTKESAVQLMEDIDHPNVHLYWQPAVGESVARQIESIHEIHQWLTHVHIFHWIDRDKRPFEEGTEEWSQYLQALDKEDGHRYLLMEFVRNEDQAQFLRDANAIKRLVAN